MKKNKKTTLIVLFSVLVVIGIVGIFVFNNLKTAKYIENIAEKMHNAEEIENFKIKIEETALYEGRDYSKIETNTYDLKNKIINFDVTKTEYACFEEDCETIEKTTKEYRTFDGTYETSYDYKNNEGIWEKSSIEVDPNENLVSYESMYDVKLFTNIASAKLIKSENGIEEYEVKIAKRNAYLFPIHSDGEIIKSATFKIQIKDEYIIKYETSVSDWYDFNPESNFTDVKITTEIYDINNSEITIPEDIINNAVQKEY